MKIATYNVNGVAARLPVLLRWLAVAGVDRDVRGWEMTSDHAPTWIDLQVA